jgi:hypothetical protein
MAIRIVTATFLALDMALFIAAVYQPALLIAAAILALIGALAFAWTPVKYTLVDDRLIVFLRVGSRRFERVMRCSLLDRRPPLSLRVFGNGGLFAGVGYFWNRLWGSFQAYVTSGRYRDLVLVETEQAKVVISPTDPQAFVEAWENWRGQEVSS